MKTILIVDDELAIIETLRAILESEGYAVHTATNGYAALEYLAEKPVALVLADWMMPLLDGPGLWRAMQAEDAFANIPVVMISTISQRPIRPAVHFDASLTKPFNIHELLGIVEHLIGRAE